MLEGLQKKAWKLQETLDIIGLFWGKLTYSGHAPKKYQKVSVDEWEISPSKFGKRWRMSHISTNGLACYKHFPNLRSIRERPLRTGGFLEGIFRSCPKIGYPLI
jgi:hypothetical protein